MYNKRRGTTLEEAGKFLFFLFLSILMGVVAFQIIRWTPQTTPELDPQGADPNILDKLGPQTAVALIIVMVILLGWVFWLFIHFGRRLSERGYLGPLTSDALARAEISRVEDNLREDLRRGVFAALIDVNDLEFRNRYRIPKEAEVPNLSPGVTIDDSGTVLRREVDWENEYDFMDVGAPSSGDEYPFGNENDNTPEGRDRYAAAVKDWKESIKKEDEDRKRRDVERKKREQFRKAYIDEQLRLYREQLFLDRNGARDRARALLPDIDVSSFGGGWIFVLEFTTIIFIVFTALALGFVGVLGSEQIGTILASIAGYVLGKSATFRSAGGQEIVRGGEQPTAVMEAIVNQAKVKASSEEDKVNLEKQVKDLQDQLAKTKIVVPQLIGKSSAEASSMLQEKELVAEIKSIPYSEVEEGIVFEQSPINGSEVQKGSTVVLLVAKKPDSPNGATVLPLEGVDGNK